MIAAIAFTAALAAATSEPNLAIDASMDLRLQSEPAGDEEGAPALDTLFPQREWLIEFEPSLWLPGFDGDIALPNGPQVDLDRLGFGDPEPGFYGELSIRHERLTIKLSGFGVSGDESVIASSGFSIGDLDVAAGERVDSELDYVSLEAVALYRVWREELPGKNGGGVGIRLEVGGGVRYHDVEYSASSGGATQTDDGRFAEPILAAALTVDVTDRIDFGVAGSVGWMPIDDNSSFSADIVAGIRWRPHQNVGFQFGFRHFVADLSTGDDDFEFEGNLSGLFASLVIRF